jgi:amino acid transporter
VLLYLLIAAAVVIAVDAQDQELVLFYAVAVFVSFLLGLLSMVQFSRRERRPLSLAVNLLGTLVVSVTLVMNLLRGWPLLSLAAASLVAGSLWMLWTRAGRPRGISMAVQQAEAEEEALPSSQLHAETDDEEGALGSQQLQQDQTGGTHPSQAGQQEQPEASPSGEREA